MPPTQPPDLVEMEAETVIIHSDPNRGQALAMLCRVHTLSESKTPKNSSAACKDRQNWQGEEEGREKGRAPSSCLTVLQCLLCREAGEGQVGMKDCEGAVLWPSEEVQTAKNSTAFETVPAYFLILYSWRGWSLHLSCWSQPGDGELRPPSPSPHSLRTAAMDGMLFLTLLHPTQSKAEHWDC